MSVKGYELLRVIPSQFAKAIRNRLVESESLAIDSSFLNVASIRARRARVVWKGKQVFVFVVCYKLITSSSSADQQ